MRGIKEYYAILNTNYEIVEFTELFQIDDEEAEDGIGWESSKYGKLKPNRGTTRTDIGRLICLVRKW